MAELKETTPNPVDPKRLSSLLRKGLDNLGEHYLATNDVLSARVAFYASGMVQALEIGEHISNAK